MHMLQRVHRDCNERARSLPQTAGELGATGGVECGLGEHSQDVIRLSSWVDKGEPQHGTALPLGRNTQNSAFERKTP
jgi:hypothetical protein